MPEKNNFTQNLLDVIGEGVFAIDKNFRITFFNRAAEEMTGYKRGEVLGKLCKTVCDPARCLAACPIAHALQLGKRITGHDCTLLHRGGRVLNVKLNAAILYDAGGEPDGGVISFRDLSEFEDLKTRLAEKTCFYGLAAHNKNMLDIFHLVEEIADSDAPVLIQGEPGTGKEKIANAIRSLSSRKNAPYIRMNCAIFSPQLLAAELFGHVKGAFSGAVKDRQGRLELANGGTIFLDEVTKIPLEIQLSLLHFLQEGRFERLGESLARTANVRIIAATDKNLQRALANGEFRADLYYRLNVIPIEIPPLRARLDDIPVLVHHFGEKFAMLHKRPPVQISDEAMDLLLRYTWPGNVRELENAMEYAFARTPAGEPVSPEKLLPKIRQAAPATSGAPFPGQQEIEILQLLNKHQWNKTKVAKELGLGRTTLWRKMKALGLKTE